MKKIFRLFSMLLLVGLIAGCSGKPAQSKLAKEMNLDKQQEAAMIETFTQCGIGKIVSVKKCQRQETTTSYHVQDKEVSAYKGENGIIVVYINNDTKAVEQIYFKDNDIFLNGQAIAPITNFYVNSKDREQYRLAIQTAINKMLKVPDSAKYPPMGEWAFGMEDDVVIVQSRVTAKNAFNVEIKHPFQVKFQNKRPISFIIDGKEYME